MQEVSEWVAPSCSPSPTQPGRGRSFPKWGLFPFAPFSPPPPASASSLLLKNRKALGWDWLGCRPLEGPAWLSLGTGGSARAEGTPVFRPSFGVDVTSTELYHLQKSST